ncbi:E3 ubiquitin-protein ligase RNF220-like [Portunus trituberculatus]|uniref:E3 ubiquitin-protein ligase RNF220-like n=1 Tax=Portunus trituberculatus TaxID=210409 RepID=UPI001E1CF479|nr:E3 ubiquitin-protein ligase RNF220-like [Portunus trituberculatus]XP_045131629.1 E3 ubiquitin-protein ligase RNF220-like [Portunus trituberculatus]
MEENSSTERASLPTSPSSLSSPSSGFENGEEGGGGGGGGGGVGGGEMVTRRKKRALEETRSRRRKARPGESWCPVCGVTLRAGELDAHLTHELDKLARLPHARPPSHRTPTAPAQATPTAPTQATPSTSLDGRVRGAGAGLGRGASWQEFRRVRGNREVRRRRRGRGGGGGAGVEVVCPVCGVREGDAEVEGDIHLHVDACLRRVEEEGDEVEVEVEEYEWCGETRVRATQMLRAEGQLHALGTRVERGSEDEVVEVCEDEVEAFGPPQFTDSDLPPSLVSTYEETSGEQGGGQDTVETTVEATNGDENGVISAGEVESGAAVVEALRVRVRELEAACQRPLNSTCRVCHEDYEAPLVSISCWHVHCRACWLGALATRRLCPQCSVITAPSDLRRVYL